MNNRPSLPNHLNGRDIFTKVIPTVNTLPNLFISLDKKDWDYSQLKNWEKPIYNAFLLNHIKSELKSANNEIRPIIIREHLLKINPAALGAHPVCIYLVAYYLSIKDTRYSSFGDFIVKNGVSDKSGSAQAIWAVGSNSGKYINVFDDNLNIVDWDFLEKWSSVKNGLSHQKSSIQLTDHLDYFLSIDEDTKWIGGVNSYDWCKYVLNSESGINSNLNQKFYRDDLLAYCNDVNNSDLDALLAILSWGGMHREHGRKLLAKPDTVLDIVNKLRTKYFSTREQAYSHIKNQRNNNLLPGLGIGYYTKLICFLAPNLNGYIMDQWLAKSINLIADNRKIKIDSSGWVNDDNNEDIYEYFCQEVDKIASKLEVSGFKAEERLFSIGGRKKGIWRQYIVDNYR